MTRVLQVLDHSLPEQSGYAYRSHAILCELNKRGVELAAVTGPKQGADAASATIDGITYQRAPSPAASALSGVSGQLKTVSILRSRIRQLVAGNSFDVLHVHSPCLNGLAALGAGVPVIYEMRSSWEDAAVSVGTTTAGSLRYRLSRWLETFVVRRADAVVVICEGLREELVARGLPKERITVVPNALPEEMFALPTEERVAAASARYGLAGKKVIGFFGSFFEWEGVADLVAAMPGIIEAVPEAHLLLAGGGRQEADLRAMVERLALENKVTFAGRVPHDEVRALYGAVDLMVFPRVSDRLTNMVTPIKPLEAMAQNAVVVASDVGGHRELIDDGETGFLYTAGNAGALVNRVCDALTNEAGNDKVREQARSYVERERRWSVVSGAYLPLYRELAS